VGCLLLLLLLLLLLSAVVVVVAAAAAAAAAGDYEELSMIPPVKLLSVVMQNCTGQVGQPHLQSVLLSSIVLPAASTACCEHSLLRAPTLPR
jgi:hypothetical protein